MSKHLARDLDALQRSVLGMAGRAEEAIYTATAALQAGNVRLAERVIHGDAAIDQLENELYEECLKLLALHQPVAVDLRQITSTFHVTTDLERIGDLAVEIAERTLAVAAAGRPTRMPDQLLGMCELAGGMVRLALDSFVALDPALARRVIHTDDELDALHVQAIDALVKQMTADPSGVPIGLSLFSCCRSLERIGDHATNIAEDVVYLVDGEVVRHRMR